jgi:filamentous hemagglutinin family protein
MLDRINTKWRWLSFLLPGILLPLRIALAAGGITTDGTVGPAQSLTGSNVAIPQNLGTTVGKNLFHSFDQFNVNAGQAVTFTENAPHALDNVISRVTGGSRSDINGMLRSTPSGHANLYLVNPSGVMFGQNARIDVAGAFHASTADEVRFQDGAKFSASQPSDSTLTAAAPASFGFLGTSSATNGMLKVNGAQLAVKEGQKLDMVGRNISVENDAKLSAPSGEVRLEAVGKDNISVPINQPSKAAHGALSLTKSTIDTSGEGGGKVIIRGSDLNMAQEAKIIADTYGKKNGAGIDAHLTGDMSMKGGSEISASVLDFGSGNAKGVIISAKNVRIEGRHLNFDNPNGIVTKTSSRNSGNAGDISLTANENILISGNSHLLTGADGFFNLTSLKGKPGNIYLTARNFEASFGAIIDSSNLNSEGGSGDINIRATDSFHIFGQGQFNNPLTGRPPPSMISSLTSGTGRAGKIDIQSPSLNITDSAIISGATEGAGMGSDIVLRGKNIRIDSAEINARSSGTGNAGAIIVAVQGDVAIKCGSAISASTSGNGTAGNILITAKNIHIEGEIPDTAHQTNITTITTSRGSGNAGNIILKANENISISGNSRLFSGTSNFQGKAGNISLTARNLEVSSGATIDSSNLRSKGGSGDINIRATDSFHIFGQGKFKRLSTGETFTMPSMISSLTSGTGRAGKIDIQSPSLNITDSAIISGATEGAGMGSDIVLRGKNIRIDSADVKTENKNNTDPVTGQIKIAKGASGNIDIHASNQIHLTQNALISSKSYSEGNAGKITIITQGAMNINEGSGVDTSTLGNRSGGNIFMSAKNLLIDGQTKSNGQLVYSKTGIVSETHGSSATDGRAGDIELRISDQLSLIRGGQISSLSFSKGEAGNIMVKAGQLLIDTQGTVTSRLGNPLQTGIFTAAARPWSSTGGNISVTVQSGINMKGGGVIDSGTFGSHAAGNILVNAKNLLIDGQTRSRGQPFYLATGIASETRGSSATDGKAGDIELRISDQLSLIRGGQISSSSFSAGDASNIKVKTNQLLIDTQGVMVNSFGNPLQTGIFTDAPQAWSGEGGDIAVTVQDYLDMKGGGLISGSSFGAKNAGNITVNANQLSLNQESYISTEANNSNGGKIDIRSQLIQLINSGVTTSVQGQQGGDGGNIKVSAKNLVMETGLIQANTEAPQASGGDITLDLEGLIPSGETLIQGGDQPVDWQPYIFGLNVIQAAAPNGISGNIQSTAPQLNLSGVLANLGGPQFDTSAISQDYCALGTGSSLIRQGKGGLLPRSRDSVMY